MTNLEFTIKLNAAKYFGWESSCKNKIRFRSANKAKDFAIHLSNKMNKRYDYYPCPFCKGYHVGHYMSLKDLDRIPLVTGKFIIRKNI